MSKEAKRLEQWMIGVGDAFEEPGLRSLVWRCARAALAGGAAFQINEVLAAVNELTALDAAAQRERERIKKAKAKGLH